MGLQTTERWISDDAKRLHDGYLKGASDVAETMRAEAAKWAAAPPDLEEQIRLRVMPLIEAAVSLRAGFVAIEGVWTGPLPETLTRP